MAELVSTVAALREKAQAVMPKAYFDYYDGGADDERTVRENRMAWRRLKLLPRVMRNLASVDPSCALLGHKLAFPLLVAPTAQHQLAHKEAEGATARAAEKCGIPMCLSDYSSMDIEDVKLSGAHPIIFAHASVMKSDESFPLRRDVEFVRWFLRRVYSHGCRVIVLTVDMATTGNRERDTRNRFEFDLSQVALLRKSGFGFGGDDIHEDFKNFQDHGIVDADWGYINFIKSVVDVKVILKGILSSADAALAVENGADGIIVSNHGGRQLDTVVTAVDVLPQIAKVVNKRIPILADGGIQRGTDIIKALAMGASAVLIGRPVLYALAAEGSQGIVDLIEDIKDQFCRALALCGCGSVDEITSDILAHV